MAADALHEASCAGLEARILELSWYGDAAVPVPLGGAFHSRRLRLVASQVGKQTAGLWTSIIRKI